MHAFSVSDSIIIDLTFAREKTTHCPCLPRFCSSRYYLAMLFRTVCKALSSNKMDSPKVLNTSAKLRYNFVSSSDIQNYGKNCTIAAPSWGAKFQIFVALIMKLWWWRRREISLIAVEWDQCTSHYLIENSKSLNNATILGGGRVCVGNFNGNSVFCAIFKKPEAVEDFIVEYNQAMYASFSPDAPFFSAHLKYVLHAVQENSISISAVTYFVVNSKFHSKSIEGRACAHPFLMAPVKAGDVSRARKYNGEDIFW